ncbi:MAG: YjbQ family protein [Candidatus Omnitrophica bacterium]|nr:YjbQ family protein [Candidatus Omnitrophota bacterium]
MGVATDFISIKTRGKTDIIDITADVCERLSGTGLAKGCVTVFVSGSTGGLTTIEYEPALVSDTKTFFDKLIPSNAPYAHDATWGDANGHSHLRSTLLGPSLTVPFVDGELTLGTWQQIIFIDFDNRPRNRKLILQFIGE